MQNLIFCAGWTLRYQIVFWNICSRVIHKIYKKPIVMEDFISKVSGNWAATLLNKVPLQVFSC